MRGYRCRGVWRDVLVDADPSSLDRTESRTLPREYNGRNSLDRGAAADLAGHGDSGHQGAYRYLRHQRVRAGYPDHRLLVEVALQVPGSGRRILQQPDYAAEPDQ